LKAERSDRIRITAALFASQSFFSAAMIASFTLWPILAAQLSGQDGAAGVPSTVSLFGRALAAYPIGWLMDRMGRRFGLSLGFGLGVIGMVVTIFAIAASSFLLFLLGIALFGMGRGAVEQARYVAAEVQPRHERARAMGWIVSAGTIGAIGGPALVDPSIGVARNLGLLAETGPFLLGAIFTGLGFVLIWLFLRPDPSTMLVPDPASADLEAEPTGSLWQLFTSRRLLVAISAMTLSQLVMTLVMVITPLHMDHQNHATGAISLVIMAHTLGMFGLSWLTGSLIDKYGRLGMMFAGSALLVVSAVITPMATSVTMLALALFLLGLGWNFCFVAGSSMLQTSVSTADRGRVQGAGEVIVSLASGVGSLGSGAVFVGGGILAVSGVALATVLVLLAIAAWFSWSHRTAVTPT
jgi:MFS family permease